MDGDGDGNERMCKVSKITQQKRPKNPYQLDPKKDAEIISRLQHHGSRERTTVGRLVLFIIYCFLPVSVSSHRVIFIQIQGIDCGGGGRSIHRWYDMV